MRVYVIRARPQRLVIACEGRLEVFETPVDVTEIVLIKRIVRFQGDRFADQLERDVIVPTLKASALSKSWRSTSR
jgi:hypothetical protein